MKLAISRSSHVPYSNSISFEVELEVKTKAKVWNNGGFDP